MEDIDSSLIGRQVRVIFQDPGDPSGRRPGSKLWKGVLTNIGENLIELTNDGHKSYISKGWIIAIMESLEPEP